ncbi:MAG: pilus assembly PilX family protein [Burkholderiaceae bacterium]
MPIVLVILTVLTGLVVTQIRRSTVDERLAANTRETVVLDNAVQTALRWCEARVIAAPNDTVTIPVNVTAPGVPPWTPTSATWNNDALSLNFVGSNLLPGSPTDPTCIIEDATCELLPPISPTGQNGGGCNGIDDRWKKYRITARVQSNAADLVGALNATRSMFAQSELRLYID